MRSDIHLTDSGPTRLRVYIIDKWEGHDNVLTQGVYLVARASTSATVLSGRKHWKCFPMNICPCKSFTFTFTYMSTLQHRQVPLRREEYPHLPVSVSVRRVCMR